MPEPTTPAGKLVAAFGDVEAMERLYASDVQWSLPRSTPFPSPIAGVEAVLAFNRQVWGTHYEPECEVEILDEAGNASASAVRFTYRAVMKPSGTPYENEYTLFARADETGIREVFEAFDTLRARQVARGED